MILNKKSVLMVLLMACTIAWAEYKIHTDISYHSAKDEGYFVRLETVCILSAVFFAVMCKGFKRRLAFAILGFFAGMLSGLLSYVILGMSFGNFKFMGITTSVLSCILFMAFFFLAPKIYNRITTHFK